ncbi:MAG TPA: alpha/beta hydrolase [Ilumatobacteraceae bacterium]|nr:alpha/beta hydrolase [Ilumatobacteraceae bacterium]
MDLEREYSPSSRVGGSAEPFVADYVARSAAARAQVPPRSLKGGHLLAEATPGAPLLVYVHGGYWQALSAADSWYLAPGAVAAGWSFAAVEYTLAPAVTIEQMVVQVAAGVAGAAAELRPSAVVLAGHSAGAHLAAMVALVAPARAAVDRLVLISGVYDLRPLVHTTVNDALGLDEGAAAELSPALLPLVDHRPHTVVVWGDNDTDAFRAQGAAFARRCGADAFECPGRHHFDIVDDLVDPATRLGAVSLAARTTAPGRSAPG